MDITMYAGFSQMLGAQGVEKTLDYVVKMGFSSVEMFVDLRFPEQNSIPDVETAERVREALRKRGLTVACYSVYANIWDTKEHIEGLLPLVDIAAALGSPFFHHTMLPWKTLDATSPEYEIAIQAATDAAARVADYAEKLGITCIYEDQGQYLNGVVGFYGFWTRIKTRCRNVGICGDLGNILFVNEMPESFLKAYIEDICHVHVKDYLQKQSETSPGMYWLKAKDNSWLRDTMIGSGVVNIEACIKILKKAGYHGAFALELGHPEPFDEGVKQAMEYLQRFW